MLLEDPTIRGRPADLDLKPAPFAHQGQSKRGSQPSANENRAPPQEAPMTTPPEKFGAFMDDLDRAWAMP